MANVIDFNHYIHTNGAIAEPTSLNKWRRPGPEVSSEKLEAVQYGIGAAATYLDTDGYTVTGDYDGYDLAEGLGRSPSLLVGQWGVNDFSEGFRLALQGNAVGADIVQAANIAYGAYGAARLILPEIYEGYPAVTGVCLQLANEYSERHPETSVRKAMEIVTRRAAATIAVLSLQKIVRKSLRDAVVDAADSGNIVENRIVAKDFQQRLSVEDVHELVSAQSPSGGSNVVPLFPQQ